MEFMKITLEFIGVVLNNALEKKRAVEVDEGITMLDFLKNEMNAYEGFVDILSGDPPRPTSNFIILVNGREISVLSGLETELKSGDEVAIIPVSHGGWEKPVTSHFFMKVWLSVVVLYFLNVFRCVC